MYDLIEPIGLVSCFAEEPDEALMALGLRNPWDAYFAGRPAPSGLWGPAWAVHAAFYTSGRVRGGCRATVRRCGSCPRPRRRWPRVSGVVPRACGGSWGTSRTIPASRGPPTSCCGGGAGRRAREAPALPRAAGVVRGGAPGAPVVGRPLSPPLRTAPAPAEPVARLWHAAT